MPEYYIKAPAGFIFTSSSPKLQEGESHASYEEWRNQRDEMIRKERDCE